ncbi:MAG TPA: hypothetical protein DCR14_04435 [Acidimicrobiaceae bacterium]|nr:hypothetical protein [Acidimicrobiaceae bacterium]
MPELRSDAQLVAAYTAGDRSALAGMYDRFGAGLYDTAAAMLRDRHEAADATQDVFLIAAERLGQLRDPERLKPWLYAILRNEVYRRTKKRGRALPTDFSAMGAPEMAAPIQPDAEGEMVAAGELAELVRSAACGLDERDQLLLELSVRQGLQGADLAAALGVTPEQSYTLVHRMRERVERSLGAVVVARAGRKDCPDLADILKGWDGEFTILIRKRVARHVEACDTCQRTRKKAAPLVLMGAAPAFAAPPDLRDRIMGSLGQAPSTPYEFTGDGGFPTVLKRFKLPVGLGAAAAIVVLGVGGGTLAATTFDTDDPPAAVTSVVVTEVPTTATVADSITSSSSTSSTSSTTSTSTTVLLPGSIEVLAGMVDLGATANSGSVEVRNNGQLPIDWSTAGGPAPFALVGAGGTLQPGQTAVLTVTINRGGLNEGTYERQVNVTDSAGNTRPLVLRARVERPPVLDVDGPEGIFYACQWSPMPMVYVQFNDESGVTAPLTVQWSDTQSGANTLTTTQANFAEGRILVRKPDVGEYEWVVTATDTRGNVGTFTGSFEILPCAG